MQDRIYLDNAATSWPKLPSAVDAAVEYIQQCGATTGRGAYQSALIADRWLADARLQLARLINAASSQSIAVCSSGTHALNAGLWGVLRDGDHVITTSAEHNSQLRPLHHWSSCGISHSVVDVFDPNTDPIDQARQLARASTRLIAVNHASNVTGQLQELRGWAGLARELDAIFLVDASQTVGYIEVNVEEAGIDILAAAGHKGLRGLAGTGFLYVAPKWHEDFRPLLYGGTGSASETLAGGQAWPQCVEVGNLNLPGVVSMAVAAKRLVEDRSLLDSWQPAFELLTQRIEELPKVRPVSGSAEERHSLGIPVMSVTIDGWDVHDFASVLDENFGIEVRAGWHCAALAHGCLQTDTTGGTLRLSPGHSTTSEEIVAVINAFAEILSEEI